MHEIAAVGGLVWPSMWSVMALVIIDYRPAS